MAAIAQDPKYDHYDFPTVSNTNQSGHPGHTTPEQDAQVHQLRASLEQSGFHERLDTLTMLRFLRARKFNVEHAKQMYVWSRFEELNTSNTCGTGSSTARSGERSSAAASTTCCRPSSTRRRLRSSSTTPSTTTRPTRCAREKTVFVDPSKLTTPPGRSSPLHRAARQDQPHRHVQDHFRGPHVAEPGCRVREGR